MDPLVPEESRWHSSRHGTVATPDAIGDALVATLREAAREAPNALDASVVAFCGRQVARQLVEYEREPRLLAKLADTGRVVTVLLQATRTATEALPEHESGVTLTRRKRRGRGGGGERAREQVGAVETDPRRGESATDGGDLRAVAE